MTGLTRRQAAEALGGLFGTQFRYLGGTYKAYEVPDREDKVWKIVYDSSIRPVRPERSRYPEDEYKVEMNSPKLEYSEMGKLQEVVRTLRRAGAVVNSSCGMHVHVDASRHTPQSLNLARSQPLHGFSVVFHRRFMSIFDKADLYGLIKRSNSFFLIVRYETTAKTDFFQSFKQRNCLLIRRRSMGNQRIVNIK